MSDLVKELRLYEGESDRPGTNVFGEAANMIDEQQRRIVELESAARKLVFLDMCDQEGIGSGQPDPEEWIEAFDALRVALNWEDE